MQVINHWLNFETPAQVAEAVCSDIMQHAEQAIAARASFKLVLAGGTTPEQVYKLLSKQQTDWSKWFIYYGDERCLPSEHAERNSLMAQQAWLNHVPIPAINIFSMPAELGPVIAAQRYAESIADALPFDMVLLGMGEDGHTASLFPGHSHPDSDNVVTVFNSPKPPPERISLSAGALSNSRRVVFIVTGASKQTAVTQWQAGVALPVSSIAPADGVSIYIDKAALGQ